MQPPSRLPPDEARGECGILSITALPGQVGLSLAGDVDLSNHEQLHSALAALACAHGTIHLELSRLRFIDVAGTRELGALAQADQRRRLILHDPPGTLRRILALLWPGSNLEIRISQPSSLPADPGNGAW
ncbi:MAG: STAS domain-containing protein [Actinobacteria bacterium]|nr:STAS domain-containing protein [Actinomycetota bacterium]